MKSKKVSSWDTIEHIVYKKDRNDFIKLIKHDKKKHPKKKC